MATVAATRNDYQIDHQVFTWTPLTTTNADGSPAGYAGSGQRCVTCTGTFGVAGSMTVQGSNDGVNWFVLNDVGGTAIAFAAAGLKNVREDCIFIRPFVTAGDGTTSLTAILSIRRNYTV